jgi:hypothetical protein
VAHSANESLHEGIASLSKLRRLVRLISFGLLGAAVYQEMSKDPAERTGQGMVGGVVPYDFRPPTFERFRDGLWNPSDPRLFVPTVFGVGWSINLAQLGRLFQQLSTKKPGF